MRNSIFSCLFIGVILAASEPIASADDSNESAIKKDRQLIEGTWKIVALEVNGNKVADADARKLTVVNGSEGTWSLRSDGKEVSRGTTMIDPTKKTKTIDIRPTEGGGKDDLYPGIYELNENTRKLCFAPPGKARPADFTSNSASEHILVTFEREKEDIIKRDLRRIEGTWTVVALETNGNKAGDDDARKLKVVIGADGSWSLNVDGREVAQGTSSIDPTKTPKIIDFKTVVGEDAGKQSLGIYEVGETSMKFCVATSGKERPGDFASLPGSDVLFLTLEREETR
ncbi:MAG: TIGR03067 domain-containing protein [Schlesneria sp.]